MVLIRLVSVTFYFYFFLRTHFYQLQLFIIFKSLCHYFTTIYFILYFFLNLCIFYIISCYFCLFLRRSPTLNFILIRFVIICKLQQLKMLLHPLFIIIILQNFFFHFFFLFTINQTLNFYFTSLVANSSQFRKI